MNRKKSVGRMRTSALVFALLLGHANSFAVPFFTANATVSVGPKVDNLFFIMWFHLVLGIRLFPCINRCKRVRYEQRRLSASL